MKPVSGGTAMCGWLSRIRRRSVVPEPIAPMMKIGPPIARMAASIRAGPAAARAMLGPMAVLILSASIGAGHDLPARLLADALAVRGVRAEIRDGLAAMGPLI